MNVEDIPWTWLAIRGTGITAWLGLTAVVVWGLLLRTRLLAGRATPLTLLETHRWLGALTLTFLAVHVGLLLVDASVAFTPAQLLIPFTAPWQPIAVGVGQLAIACLIPVAVAGRLRARLGKNGAKTFTRAHKVAYAAWPLATAHYILAGTDTYTPWSLALLAAGTSALAFTLLTRAHVPAPARPTPGRARTEAPASHRRT